MTPILAYVSLGFFELLIIGGVLAVIAAAVVGVAILISTSGRK